MYRYVIYHIPQIVYICTRIHTFIRKQKILVRYRIPVFPARLCKNFTHVLTLFQKISCLNGNKNQTIIQHRSNRTLCPVKAWGTLITLILSYEKTSTLTPINYFVHDNGPSQITATDMITQIRAACKTLGEQKIGIEIDRVGTHSIRMSFAMQLHLAGVKDHIIMMQGRWKSLSFLRYIRLQIQELSEDLSRKMASTATAHFNISNTRRNIVKTEILH